MRAAEMIARADKRAHVQALHRGVWVDCTLVRWGGGQSRGRRARVRFVDGSERTVRQDDVRLPQC